MLFIPSVGPGYDDTRVRPWNGDNVRSRADGDYYRREFKAAMEVGPDFISITSFNEWHEGTQIEPAVPKTDTINDFTYKTYNEGPNQYLALTRSLLSEFAGAKVWIMLLAIMYDAFNPSFSILWLTHLIAMEQESFQICQ